MADVLLSTVVGGGGRKVPTAIMGRSTMTPLAALISSTAGFNSNIGEQYLSGEMSAGIYKQVLNVATPGVLKLALVASNNTTSRNISMRLTLNGVVVYDVTAVAVALAQRGLVPVGSSISSQPPTFDNIPFDTMSIDIKSSLTETDALTWMCVYDLE